MKRGKTDQEKLEYKRAFLVGWFTNFLITYVAPGAAVVVMIFCVVLLYLLLGGG